MDMSDVATSSEPFAPGLLRQSRLVPLPAFPPAVLSVFGTGALSPSAGPMRTEFPDFSDSASLEAFASATGIPDVAFQFAEALSAQNADDLFHIPRDVWDQSVRTTVISRITEDELGEESRQERCLTAVEMGKLNKGRDALHVAAKMDLEDGSRLARPKAAPSAPVSPGSRPVSGMENEVSIKLNQVIDDTLTGTATRIDTQSWSRMAKVYKDKFGALPKRDQEPSIEQVSALQQILASATTPFVDFAIWGPYGRRVLRRLANETTSWDPSAGKLVTNTRKGPGAFDAWYKSWAVFKNAMLFLEEATVSAMDGYRDHIQELSQTYPTCWFIIYNADCRCRSEQLEYILRDAAAAMLSREEGSRPLALQDFHDEKPWDYVFKQAVSEENMVQHSFWQREVHIKCTQYLNKTTTFAAIVGDGTTLQSPSGGGKRGSGQDFGGGGAPQAKKPYNPKWRSREPRAQGPQYPRNNNQGGWHSQQQQGGWKKQEWHKQPQQPAGKGQKQEWQGQGWQKQDGQQQPKKNDGKGGKGGSKGGKGNKGGKGGKGGQNKGANEN
jgi:hypothetical protein